MKFERTNEFKRDIKKLSKKYITIEEDLEKLKSYSIELFHCEGVDNKGIFLLQQFNDNEVIRFYKVKKFACRALKGKGAYSGLRLIYAFLKKEAKIVFLEIYHKNDKFDFDRKRLSNFAHKQ